MNSKTDVPVNDIPRIVPVKSVSYIIMELVGDTAKRRHSLHHSKWGAWGIAVGLNKPCSTNTAKLETKHYENTCNQHDIFERKTLSP